MSRSHMPRGFSLIELMVAITLGILVSIGLVTFFGATGKTNRVQDALARIQENGRYAISRMSYDLRLASRQPMSSTGYGNGSAPGTNGAVSLVDAPQVYVASIAFPDMATALGKPSGWDTGNALAWWPLSPRYFIQGYECSSGTCSPADPLTTYVPAAASTPAAGSRVAKSDVLTVRYLNTAGLSYYEGDFTTTCNGPSLTLINFSAAGAGKAQLLDGDLVMLTSSGFSAIFKVAKNSTTQYAPTGVLNSGTVPCFSTSGAADVTLYNFSANFVSVTYWLQYSSDPNNPGGLIPSLWRSQGGNRGTAAQAQELVQGVEQLDFLYSSQANDGSVSFLTASDITGNTAITCAPPPVQYLPPNLPAGTLEPQCLWRSVKNVEMHILVDNVNNMYDLANADLAYQYNGGYNGGTFSYTGTTAPPANQQGGTAFGRMLRREFVSLVSVRNYNP